MTETPQEKSPQQVLADLIDAYAPAKVSQNETLVRLSIAPLQTFLQTHTITEIEVEEPEAPKPTTASKTPGRRAVTPVPARPSMEKRPVVAA